ncbi:MAG: alpha/beta hydrolase [Parvularculaceae bacterium]
MAHKEQTGFVDGAHGRIAYRRVPGDGPAVIWLGGYKSDMTGTKAEAISEWAAQNRRSFLRFDYSGHGASEGNFEDGTISSWLVDALVAIDQLTKDYVVLVGSSMGGWIATLAALRRPSRVGGLVLIAPAPDFTERLMWDQMSEAQRETLMREGRLLEPTQYSDEPNVITKALIEDGRRHLLLGGPVQIHRPIRIIQGMDDPDVPWRHAVEFAECLETDDLEVRLIKGGDHRLSKPHEIAAIIETIAAFNEVRQ